MALGHRYHLRMGGFKASRLQGVCVCVCTSSQLIAIHELSGTSCRTGTRNWMQPFQWASRSMKMISLPMRRMPPATLKNRVSDGNSCRGKEVEQSQANYSQCPTPPPIPPHPYQPLHPSHHPYQPLHPSHPTPTNPSTHPTTPTNPSHPNPTG